MVYKIFLVFFFIINLSYGNIIYDKNNLIITEFEYQTYLKVYKENYGDIPSRNYAIRNIVLIKKTIDNLTRNNPDLLANIDSDLKKRFGNEIFKNQITIDLLRFMKLKNDFISNYYFNEFSLIDLNNIFNSFNEILLPVSTNQCLTILKFENLKNDKYFTGNFYKNLKSNSKKYQTNIDGNIYDVCIDENNFNLIESSIINFIEKKIEKNFNQFIYININ